MGLISKNKKQKQESNENNTKQKQIQKTKAIVGVCSAGMRFCSRAEACSSSFSSVMLRDTVVFDYKQFSKFHTHNGDDTLPRFSYLKYSCC